MYSQQSVLLITKQNEVLTTHLEEICYNKNLTLAKLYNISDGISAVNEFRYGLLIIDTKHYQIGLDMLSLFKRKDFYVPSVILVSEKNLEIADDNVDVVKRNDLDKMSELITDNLNKTSCKFPLGQVPYIRTTIEKQLTLFGFSRRYKGFDYMADIIMKILNNTNSKISFKKYIYPYISSLYNVSEESVERDIRNLISKMQPSHFFSFKLTTKNVVTALVCYIKDYLNKLGNYKLSF